MTKDDKMLFLKHYNKMSPKHDYDKKFTVTIATGAITEFRLMKSQLSSSQMVQK